MPLDSISQLGEKIGGLSNQQSDIKQSLTPDESNAQFNFGFTDTLKINGNIVVSKYTYDTTSFILDHPVQGCLDTAINNIPNVVAYYNLESNFNDQIGTKHGSSTNVTFSTGKIGNGASFNGTSSTASLLQMSNYTSSVGDIMFWAYVSSTSTGVRRLFTLGDTILYNDGSGNLTFLSGVYSTSWAISTGYHFYRMTFTNGSVGVSLYEDNVLKSSPANTANFLGSTLYIGSSGVPHNFYNNIIDEIYINNSITATSIVNSIYNSGNGLVTYTLGPFLLDGGYVLSGVTPAFPAAFPWVFDSGGPIKETLFSYSY